MREWPDSAIFAFTVSSVAPASRAKISGRGVMIWPTVVSWNAMTDSIISRSSSSTTPSFSPSSTADRISFSISSSIASGSGGALEMAALETRRSTACITRVIGQTASRRPCR